MTNFLDEFSRKWDATVRFPSTDVYSPRSWTPCLTPSCWSWRWNSWAVSSTVSWIPFSPLRHLPCRLEVTQTILVVQLVKLKERRERRVSSSWSLQTAEEQCVPGWVSGGSDVVHVTDGQERCFTTSGEVYARGAKKILLCMDVLRTLRKLIA